MKHRNVVIQNLFFCGFLFWLALSVNAAQNGDIRVTLEEPGSDGTYAGISNLRGWAISPYGIDKVELYIDGVYMYDIPYGGTRTDVGNAYPGYPDADYSGFSMAFNYKNLTPGSHTITIRAIDMSGDYNDSTASFTALRFNSTFIADTESVDVTQITAYESLDNNRFKLSGIEVEGSRWNLVIGWNRATQGFEIEQISLIDNQSITGSWSGTGTSSAYPGCSASISGLLTQSGNTITGSGSLYGGNCISGGSGQITGQIYGRDITFGLAFDNQTTISFTGSISDDGTIMYGEYFWPDNSDYGVWEISLQ